MTDKPDKPDKPPTFLPTAHTSADDLLAAYQMGAADLKAARREAVLDFVQRVNERAEAHIAATHVVTGAHYNAMRQVLRELGYLPTSTPKSA